MKLKNTQRESLIGFSFIGLWLIGFIGLTLYPLIQTLIYSFQKVNITTDGITTESIGFENYKDLFQLDVDFLDDLRLFVQQILLYVPIIIVFAMIAAIILNQKIRLRGLFRSIYFLPVIIVSGPIVSELFSQGVTQIPLIEQYGIISMIENTFPEAIAEPIAELFSEMIFILWMSGVQIIIFLAGLQKIDPSVYEAAEIDGANAWEAFWKITLPSLGTFIAINVLYTVVTLSTFATNDVLRKIRRDMFSPSTGYGYASAETLIYFISILMIFGLFVFLYIILIRRKRKS